MFNFFKKIYKKTIMKAKIHLLEIELTAAVLAYEIARIMEKLVMMS